MLDISVVIPVYNAEHSLTDLHSSIEAFFKENPYTNEVIFVYDCGTDNSWNVLKNIKNSFPEQVVLIRLTRNYGQHNAILAGIKHSKGKFIVTMDDDLQHDPHDIKTLLKTQSEKDWDVVYGKYHELNHSWFRNITSSILKLLLKVSIPELHPDYSAYRLVKREIAMETLKMNNSYTFYDGYLSWVTTKVSSATVKHNPRQKGESSYTIKKLINHSINIFVTFSNFPIRLVTISSFIILILSGLFSIYLIIRKLVVDDFIAGYASFMVVLGFGIGLILFSIGVVGEYIYRINLKTTKRPNFIEKEVL